MRVVICDEVDFLVRRGLLIDDAQEAQPFLLSVLAHAGGDDLPVQGVEGGKQRGRAMPFVVVGHRLGSGLFSAAARVASDPELGSGSSRPRQHQRMLGRIQVQAHDLFQFLGKLRVVAELETLHAVRFQAVRPPDAPHLASLTPTARAILRVLQCVAPGGFLRGLAHDFLHLRRA